jgi:uncharacterized membrane protein
MNSNTSPLLRRRVLVALFAAILMALGIPGSPLHMIGYPNLGIINATTLHIPVILGAILLGPIEGAILGLVMGATSLITAIQSNLLSAAYFANPLISVVPRILIGVVAGFLFQALKHRMKNRSLAVGITAVAGTLTNTILVVTLMLTLGSVIDSPNDVWKIASQLMSILISISCVAEVFLAVILSVAIEKALRPMLSRT